MNIIHYQQEHINTLAKYICTNIPKHQKNTTEFFNEEHFHNDFSQLELTTYAKYFEMIDDQFASSEYRISNYTIKQKRTRTIMTTIGSITFTRRQYIHRNTNEYYYHVDKLLEMIPYQRLSNNLKLEILRAIPSDSYQTVANRYNISKNAVYQLICSFRGKLITTPECTNKINTDILYIQADECYVAVQRKAKKKKSNKVRVEQVTIHTGLKPVCKGRNTLQNRMLLTRAESETLVDFGKRVYDTINEFYTYNSSYLYGDGAQWIKTLSTNLNATFILDLFHTYQSVNTLTRNKKHRDFLRECVRDDRLDEICEWSNTHLNVTVNRTKNLQYLINNWDSIQRNYKLRDQVGCSQEGINYHYFAKRLTTLPKGFSESNLRVITQLITLYHNNIDFDKILLKEVKELQDIELDKYKSKTISNNKYEFKQAKLPITNSSTHVSKVIRSIRH